ncbi:Uncharacterised protein [Yersinia intermedia]|nr:Uncharacterised protein [Yersinia intermedia]CNB92905.1 Uncharacterised protein [Yersinia intermedia]CNG85270.1 Uncharacterised protein [Yersinia intermedia]CRE90761.1 Uncharacterised protein [Yersinia intermedia]
MICVNKKLHIKNVIFRMNFPITFNGDIFCYIVNGYFFIIVDYKKIISTYRFKFPRHPLIYSFLGF